MTTVISPFKEQYCVHDHVLVWKASMTTETSLLKAAIGRPWLQSRSIFKGVHDYRHIPILKAIFRLWLKSRSRFQVVHDYSHVSILSSNMASMSTSSIQWRPWLQSYPQSKSNIASMTKVMFSFQRRPWLQTCLYLKQL